MNTSGQRLLSLLLVPHGILSALLSLLALGMFTWGGWPLPGQGLLAFAIAFPLLVSFPLFVLSRGVTRMALAGFWIAAIIEWIAFLVIAIQNHEPLVSSLTVVPVLGLILQALIASITTFAFSDFRLDSLIARKFAEKS